MTHPENTKPARSTLAVVLAGRFLLPIPDSTSPSHPGWRRAGWWLAPWGIAMGIFYAIVFAVAWRCFGEYQYIRWIPAVAVLAVDLGFCGYRFLAGTARFVDMPKDPEGIDNRGLGLPSLVTILIIAFAKFALFVSLPIGRWHSPPPDVWAGCWQYHLAFLCPGVVYRPLVLMPIWGRWAISLAMKIGSPARDTSQHSQEAFDSASRGVGLGRGPADVSLRLRHMSRGTPLTLVLAQWAILALLTALYCSVSLLETLWGLGIALGVLLFVYYFAFFATIRTRGQTESGVLAAGLLAELAFLCLYLAIGSAIYWY